MEDFVPYELAVKLKEKGFGGLCLAHYTNDNILHYNYSHKVGANYVDCLSHNLMPKDSVNGKFIDAPRISQVLDWLMDNKIYVSVEVEREDWFEYKIVQTIKNTSKVSTRVYNTYPEAILAGIEYVIDNII